MSKYVSSLTVGDLLFYNLKKNKKHVIVRKRDGEWQHSPSRLRTITRYTLWFHQQCVNRVSVSLSMSSEYELCSASYTHLYVHTFSSVQLNEL